MGLLNEAQTEKKPVSKAQEPELQASYKAAKHYREGEIELDAIEQLKSNILMLDDLQQRLQFMNNELESILGTKKRR